MGYVDISIGKYRVPSSRVMCPYVLLECNYTCLNLMMCMSCFDRLMSLYLMHEKCDCELLDLVGLRTFVMYMYELTFNRSLGSKDLMWCPSKDY